MGSNGEIPILIGTHTLIQKSVKFKNLALVIIDEQHRFELLKDVNLLVKTGLYPHLLSMTATPIPRTLSFNYLWRLGFIFIKSNARRT